MKYLTSLFLPIRTLRLRLHLYNMINYPSAGIPARCACAFHDLFFWLVQMYIRDLTDMASSPRTHPDASVA